MRKIYEDSLITIMDDQLRFPLIPKTSLALTRIPKINKIHNKTLIIDLEETLVHISHPNGITSGIEIEIGGT